MEAALQLCAQSGLEIRTSQLLALARTGPGVQHLATVLEAAAAVMRMEIRDSVAGLSRCWGLPQSHVLDAVFALAPDVALVAQPQVLTNRAMQMVDQVDAGNSIRPTIGIGILLHKLTRVTGAVPDTAPGNAVGTRLELGVESSHQGRDAPPDRRYEVGGGQGMLGDEEVSSAYAENAEFWISVIREGLDPFQVELTDPAVLRQIGDPTGLVILDAGCGEGHLTRRLRIQAE